MTSDNGNPVDLYIAAYSDPDFGIRIDGPIEQVDGASVSGNYFGVLADTGPGPLNFFDVHPRVITNWPHNVNVMTDILFYWRQNLQDGVYSVPGFLIRPAGNSRARFVGYRPGTEIRWQIDHHAYLQLDYGVFFAGPFLRQTMPGRNLNYLALWAGYKF